MDTAGCAIVTGAGSGIGRACARRLGAAGLAVAALDANGEAAAETAAAVPGAAAFTADVTDETQVATAVGEATARFGSPKVLVNAAGIIVRKTLRESTVEEWRRVLDVNLTGYFVVLREVIPRMAAGGGGSIVQIASIAGHTGYGFSSYTAAKGGVLALTRQLAAELAVDGIRINSVSPGVVHSGLNRDTLSTPEIHAATVANTPVGRIGEPDDIAAAVAFLAGPDAGYITGTDLVADGGMISTIHWGEAGAQLHSFHAREQ
ncbi:SDR family NAD(P)-dependent oxidoreductase [Amycolatopsis jiangsuensis]|uniref:NAD(P)-dependent dehydrogenase (Short-subunit alcohol dehydrogenase family) n=1 Tax=Amycolatopsis jiangsuensis TaxID=1181879 RepID=A0A840J2B2_9PSEU|nr:SDR family oxidoreductase [Amycolatopsis jiangsuensis]MBB4689201.1 NAD(P)-dependent dehydrogenase (short-subunit alcohol dehydrogenase family) [Amycolatopsis jiangsuensis]